MPSRKELSIYALLALMEVLAGFSLIVGSSLLDATSIGYGMFWLLLVSSMAGLAMGLSVATVGPRAPWNRVLLVIGAIVSSGMLGLASSRRPLSFLVGVFLLAVLYWRGLSLSQEAPSISEVQGRFGYGFAILFVGLLWVLARGILYNRAIWYMLAVIGITYTLVAMTALVVVRVESNRVPGAGFAVFLAVAIQLGLLALVSLIALQLFAFDLAGGVWQLTHPIWDAAGTTAFRMAAALSRPIEWFVALVRPAHSNGRTITYSPPVTGQPGSKPVRPHPVQGNRWFTLGAVLLGLSVLMGVGTLIWRSIPRISRQRPEVGYREQRGAIFSPGDIWRALCTWLRSLLNRGVEITDQVGGRARRRVFGAYPDDPMRRIYAQMLRRSTSAGLERLPATTPQEFHARLAVRWPNGTHHFAALTEAYELRRYGDVEIGPDDLRRLRRHWHGARSTMRASHRVPRHDSKVVGTSVGVNASPRRWWSRTTPVPRVGRDGWFGGTDFGWFRTGLLLLVCVVTPILCLVIFLIIVSTLSAHSGLPLHSYAD